MSFTSFDVVQQLRNVLGIPSTKIPIDATTFVSYILPPMIFHCILAMLVVMPGTRTSRVALWPLLALLALRAVLSVDASLGIRERNFLNFDLMFIMLFTTIRALDWALAKGPLIRHTRSTNSSPSVIMDAFDLVSNARGHGWEWSRYQSYIPREKRPLDRKAFVFCTILSAIVHCLLFSAFQRAVLIFVPEGTGPIPSGSTIFDDSLPFLVRYLRACIISIVVTLSIYSVTQMNYDLCTIPAVLVLGQDPTQWPPMFDAPWRSTSLGDFWGHRWHQIVRRICLSFGGYPLSLVLGRAGIVIGSFLASAVLHQAILMTLDGQTDLWRMVVGFGIMGPGILAERAFRRWTGRRVGGVFGWIWTMTWLIVWGTVIIEGLARAGLFGCTGHIDDVLPVRIPVEHFVVRFDAWLHSL